MAESLVPIMVRLTADQRARMQQLANDDDRTLSYMIRQAVDRYLKENR